MTLLLKWIWHLGIGNSGGKQDYIVHKYQLTFENEFSMFAHQLFPTWRAIVKVLALDERIDEVIRAFCCYKVGNDMTIWFWLDGWFSYALLRMLFPYLFRLSSQYNATIQEVYNYDFNIVTLSWNRPLRDRECQQFGVFSCWSREEFI